MSWDDMNRELSYQRIAELHADAERYRQVRASKRRRQRRSRRRLGRLLWPTGRGHPGQRHRWARSSARRGRRAATRWARRRLYHPSLGR